MSDGVPVELVGVRIELPSNQPIVLLKEVEGTRYLPIWIGAGEATAIAFALEGVQPQRPLTHDLLKLSVEALDATVRRVVVTEMRDGIYYADLVLTREGEEITVSSRPSDAIALAARTGSPIFVCPAGPRRVGGGDPRRGGRGRGGSLPQLPRQRQARGLRVGLRADRPGSGRCPGPRPTTAIRPSPGEFSTGVVDNLGRPALVSRP